MALSGLYDHLVDGIIASILVLFSANAIGYIIA